MDVKMLKSQIRIAAALFALLLVAPAPLAQDAHQANKPEISKEVKAEVLDQMSDMILKKAYVPGVDFSKWKEFVDKQKDSIDKATTEDEFANSINSALGEFGF